MHAMRTKGSAQWGGYGAFFRSGPERCWRPPTALQRLRLSARSLRMPERDATLDSSSQPSRLSSLRFVSPVQQCKLLIFVAGVKACLLSKERELSLEG